MITSMSLVELSHQPSGRRERVLVGRIPVRGDFIQTLGPVTNGFSLIVENVLLMEIDEDQIMQTPLPVAVVQVRRGTAGTG